MMKPVNSGLSFKSNPLPGEQLVNVPRTGESTPLDTPWSAFILQQRPCCPRIAPRHDTPKTSPPVEVSVVWVTEVNPPVKATPLEWLLITNSKVNDFDQAIQRIRWYRMRWQIEVYFKVLKSGTKIEHCRLQTQQRLRRYIALMSVIAWRLYWVTMYNRHAPRR